MTDDLVTKEFCGERTGHIQKEVADLKASLESLASSKDLATHMQQIGSLVSATMGELNCTMQMVADTQARVVKFLWHDNGGESVQSQLNAINSWQVESRKLKWLVIASCVSALAGMAIRANW